jgi:hypothetical protein
MLNKLQKKFERISKTRKKNRRARTVSSNNGIDKGREVVKVRGNISSEARVNAGKFLL